MFLDSKEKLDEAGPQICYILLLLQSWHKMITQLPNLPVGKMSFVDRLDG